MIEVDDIVNKIFSFNDKIIKILENEGKVFKRKLRYKNKFKYRNYYVHNRFLDIYPLGLHMFALKQAKRILKGDK